MPTVKKSVCNHTIRLSLSNGGSIENDKTNEDNWILEEIQRLLFGKL